MPELPPPPLNAIAQAAEHAEAAIQTLQFYANGDSAELAAVARESLKQIAAAANASS